MDHAAWLQQGLSDTDEAREAYRHFMRVDPDQREFIGGIHEEHDELLNRPMRFRLAKVGMTRGADLEKAKTLKVFLDPLPHIRVDHAKPLQGWYQSKNNIDPVTGRKHRPRPCFTDALLTEPYGGYCTVGCAFSLPAGEMINTPNGMKRIEEIKEGEFVWGRTWQGTVLALVKATMCHWKDEGYIRVRLSNGKTLRLTSDHPVYSATRIMWVAAGDLRHGEEVETVRFSRDGATRTNWQRDAEGETVASERKTEVSADTQANERGCTATKAEHVATGIWPKDCGVEDRTGRESASGDIWLQDVEAFSIHGSKRSRLQDAICLGGVDCCVDGQPSDGVGLRTGGSELAIGNGFHTGLQIGGRTFHRGEGLLLGSRQSEDCGGSSVWPSYHPIQTEAHATHRSVRVEEVIKVDGGLYVYDIETSTENFYQEDVLVHNCYVNSGFRGYRGSGLVSVPIAYGHQVAAMLAKQKIAAAGYFSSFTDPFLPLEDFYHNTQRGAEAFVAEGLPIFFLSRLAYPGWAYDLLRKNRYSYAQKSLNTPDAEDWQKLSPGALSLQAHLDEIRELSERGIYVSIQCNPILPGITTHDDVEKLFELLAEAGADHVIVKFVEAGFSWAPTMVERVMKRFGDNRGSAFRDLFTQNIGGEKTVSEEYRIEGHHRYRAKATKLGMTYATCYEYRYERDGDRVVDKVGVSIGREFTTADQCHGHRVPMFSRELGEAFLPIEHCPPSGCLHCATENSGSPRCGNELLGQAKALRQSDLRRGQ